MKYIIYPLIIILTSYLAVSMYSLSLDVSSWSEPNRGGFMVVIISTIIIDLIVELLNNID